MSASEISLILDGHRNASLETVEKILEHTKAPETLRHGLREECHRRRLARMCKKSTATSLSPILRMALEQLALYQSSFTPTLFGNFQDCRRLDLSLIF